MIVQTTTTPAMSSRNVVEEDVDDDNISSIDDVSSIDDLDGAPGKREPFIAFSAVLGCYRFTIGLIEIT